jgi:hypothetical protein
VVVVVAGIVVVVVVVVDGASVVVVVVVVVVATKRVIVFVDVLAGRVFVLAIFKVKTHDPVVPIVNLLGLFFGVNEQEPFFDQVFTPREFDVTTVDKLLTCPAANEDTFHVTFVADAAETEPLKAAPIRRPATNKELAIRRSFGL